LYHDYRHYSHSTFSFISWVEQYIYDGSCFFIPALQQSSRRTRPLCFTQQSLVLRKSFSPLIVRLNSKNSDDSSNTSSNSFLQDIFQSAFANDRELLSRSNKRVGMLDEGINSEDDDIFVVPKQTKAPELTPTQQAWRQKMLSSPAQQQVQTTDLVDSTIRIDLYLSGVPNKDPSNDLYASKTNISLRDRSVGQVLPTVPTIANVYVSFLPNNKCAVSTITTKVASIIDDNGDESDISSSSLQSESGNSFVNTDIIGDWKLSDDGKQIRFRISVYGFQRTIQTKGTIQKIYWSNEKESITETSTLYSIPEGWLYFETELVKRSNGSVQWMTNSISGGTNKMNPISSSSSVSNGIIKVEQTTGFLGIASRMVPCGKFVVTES
jgi:hypothetical protein